MPLTWFLIYLIKGHEVPRCGKAGLNPGYITAEVVCVYILPFTKNCRSPAEAKIRTTLSPRGLARSCQLRITDAPNHENTGGG